MTDLTANDLPSLFEDLTPIPQDDGPVSVSRIDYPGDFVTAYDYFRAVLEADERSDRAFKLTGLCLKLNPANYTVWHFRRLCLEALVGTLNENVLSSEFELAANLGGENPKNYQIWYHRRALLERLQRQDDQRELLVRFCASELDYTARVFSADSKNYHAWCYRQWIVQAIGSEQAWIEEIEFSNSMVDKDVRNNSAWNQRWFAAHRGQLKKPLILDAVDVEIDYALLGARVDPYNESPWRYLIAVLKEQMKTNKEKILPLLDGYQEKVVAVKTVLADAGKDTETCSNLMSAMLDIQEFKGDKASLQHALDLTVKLVECDSIRQKYWEFRAKQLKGLISKQ